MASRFPEDDWDFYRVIRKNWSQLLQDLDPISILDVFIDTKYIPKILARDILELPTTSEKIRKILDIATGKGLKGYEDFKACLRSSNQEYLVEILENTEKELTKEQRDEEMTKIADEEDNLDAMTTLAEVLDQGKENINVFRVMVIGCFGQGKTSLVSKLLGKSWVEPESTNGIDIHSYVGTREKWIEKRLLPREDEFVNRLQSVVIDRKLPEKNNVVLADESVDVIADDVIADEGVSSSTNLLISTGSDINNTSDAKTSHLQLMPHDKKYKSKKGTILTQKLGQKFVEALNNDTKSNKTLAGINVWDFGGQYVFYATHQLFLCRHAVYLLVFRLDVPLDDIVPDECSGKPQQRTMREYIEFWMSSVHAFVGDAEGKTPTIILVGTHKDKVDMKIAGEYFESIRQMFDERILRHHIFETNFPVSKSDQDPTNDLKINELRKAIMDIYEKQIKLCKVPVKWISLENDLGQLKEQDVLSLKEVVDLDEKGDYTIGSEQVTNFLQHHHDIGTVFFIPGGTPEPYVILNPQFIVDAFKCVITANKFASDQETRELRIKLSNEAILDPKLLDIVWNTSRFKEHTHLLQECLVKLRVMGKALQFDGNGKVTPLDFFIVPSLLRSQTKSEVRNFLENRPRTSTSLLYEFKDEAILPSIYHRFTAAAIGTWAIPKFESKYMLFTNCSVYKLDDFHCGLIKHERNCLEILVVHLCPGKVVDNEMSDRFRRYFEYVLQDITKSRDCRTDFPVSKRFKCLHEMHGENGTIASHPIEIRDEKSEVPCPDNTAHPVIYIADMLNTWFGHRDEPKDSIIPVKKLTEQQMTELSKAIGDNWQILGLALGLSNITIQHINSNNNTTALKIVDMLREWRDKRGDSGTLKALVKKLNDNETVSWDRKVVQDIVRNAKDGFSTS